MLFTLAYIREHLWRYADFSVPFASATAQQKTDADFRINQVVERLLTFGMWRNTIRRIRVPIYDECITLPRELGSLLGIKVEFSNTRCGCPTAIYSRFHEFAHCISCGSCGTYDLSDNVQTFRTPTGSFHLRVKTTEGVNKTITFLRGMDTNWDEYFDSETLTFGTGTYTTTRTWNAIPQIQKVETTNQVELYSVDSTTSVETLIAIYAPSETIPSYRRYKVPGCGNAITALIQGKLAFNPVSQDNDIVYPGVLGALKMGLKALQSEDTEEDERATRNWRDAVEILNNDLQQMDGDAEIPTFKVFPGFAAGDVCNVM